MDPASPSETFTGETVYFFAAQDTVLPLADETMPFWYDDYLYIASSVFTNRDVQELLNVYRIQDNAKGFVMIYNDVSYLIFEDGNPYAEAENGEIYEPGLQRQGGNYFVPAGLIANHFDLLYSVTEVEQGYLVWLRRTSFRLPDRIFAGAAKFQLDTRYQEYLDSRAQESLPDTQPEPLPDDSEPTEPPRVQIIDTDTAVIDPESEFLQTPFRNPPQTVQPSVEPSGQNPPVSSPEDTPPMENPPSEEHTPDHALSGNPVSPSENISGVSPSGITDSDTPSADGAEPENTASEGTTPSTVLNGTPSTTLTDTPSGNTSSTDEPSGNTAPAGTPSGNTISDDTQPPQIPEPLPEHQTVYLCLRADENTPEWMDIFDRHREFATFFCDREFLETQGGLLRRMSATGYGIGLLVHTDDSQSLPEQLETGNRLLEQTAHRKTRFVMVEPNGATRVQSEPITEFARKAREDGFLCLETYLDFSNRTLSGSTQAETLLRELAQQNMPVWLDGELSRTGLESLLNVAAERDDDCTPLMETLFP